MNIPEVPKIMNGYGNFITAQAWAALLDVVRELDGTLTQLSAHTQLLEDRLIACERNISTIAGALQEVVKNA